jgi:CRISPR-associated protein Cas2
MLIVISYDIEKDRKRTRLAKKLKDFGPRVQKSVFEADVGQQEYQKLLNILNKIELGENDSIRLYRLCAACELNVKIWGNGEVTKDQAFYIH